MSPESSSQVSSLVINNNRRADAHFHPNPIKLVNAKREFHLKEKPSIEGQELFMATEIDTWSDQL